MGLPTQPIGSQFLNAVVQALIPVMTAKSMHFANLKISSLFRRNGSAEPDVC